MRTMAALAIATALVACSPAIGSIAPGSPGNPLKINVTGTQSGAPQTVDYFFALDPDCAPEGYPVVRVIVPPRDGTLALRLDEDFSVYAKDNARFACNKKKSPVTVLTYLPNAGYVGADSATIEVLYPLGTTQRFEYMLDVR
jgi:hypothetical protein